MKRSLGRDCNGWSYQASLAEHGVVGLADRIDQLGLVYMFGLGKVGVFWEAVPFLPFFVGGYGHNVAWD